MNRQISDYQTIAFDDQFKLNNWAKKLLAEGWVPLGGISSSNSGDNWLFAQAFIRYQSSTSTKINP